MSRRIRGLRFYLEYEYSSDTKDQIEDLLTVYPSADEIVTQAILALHERHFGSISKRTPPPTFSKTFSASDDTANMKLDELWHFIQEMKDKFPEPPPVPTAVVETPQTNNTQIVRYSEEANEKILEKIDELGVRFSKIVSEPDQKTGVKAITADMSNEEVLQLIKRIDKLESKLTKAISQSRAAAPIGRSTGSGRTLKDFGEPPKIGEVKAIDGKPPELEDRPLLDDVLNTVIVSVDEDE